MNLRAIFMATILAGVACGPALAQGHYTGMELAKYAKVSIVQARVIALKTVPGKIVAEELEKEKSGLRYSFDIKVGTKTREVGVDAKTGRVIENIVEGKNPD
ncbi:MAG: PepSY domain-containing protein [Candidatus Eremiobacteraeota bacterium]|nr:PepSY domain-containing protein [Candidatus Eremiobacteraeota bacterium]